MPDSSKRIDSIRKSVEQPDDSIAQKKDLSKIIQRLREKEEDKEQEKKVETEEIDLSKYKPKETGMMGSVGSFYARFQGVLSAPARLLTKLPLSNNLKVLLESGGIYVSPEAYIAVATVVSVSIAFLTLILMVSAGVALGNAALYGLAVPIAVLMFLVTGIIILMYPVSKASERAAEIDKALPFALRQLSTQVKAGVSFYQAMLSVANSKYGVLSDELRIVLRDLDSGLSVEQALIRLMNRTRSNGLQKALQQILRSLRTGGNLSKIISDIADDVSFETRMKIRDFTEKLNFINIIYIMVSVVAPVAIAIFSAIVQLPLFAGALPPVFTLLGFLAILFLMTIIVFITKRMEPAAW
ncbi:type II secretion system F family protein [Candidatus Micrarchaeota archaeon]|nr:type II secretion system F family protein [Candidatus Micrarchaeota archaeon]